MWRKKTRHTEPAAASGPARFRCPGTGAAKTGDSYRPITSRFDDDLPGQSRQGSHSASGCRLRPRKSDRFSDFLSAPLTPRRQASRPEPLRPPCREASPILREPDPARSFRLAPQVPDEHKPLAPFLQTPAQLSRTHRGALPGSPSPTKKHVLACFTNLGGLIL